MPKFRKKSYKRNKRSIKPVKKKLEKYSDEKKKTNFKFIKRGKDMVELHRRQKELEEKYRREAKDLLLEKELEAAKGFLPEEDEVSPLEQLMAQLPKTNKNEARESDESDDDDEESGDEENEEELGEEELLDEEEMLEEDFEDEEMLEEEEDALEDEEIEENDSDLEGLGSESEDLSDSEGKPAKKAKLTPEENDKADLSDNCDAFAKHLDYDLQSEQVENLLSSSGKKKTIPFTWPKLQKFLLDITELEKGSSKDNPLEKYKNQTYSPSDLLQQGIKKTLIDHLDGDLTSFQSELLTIMAHYYDFYFPERTFDNADELRQIYCLHLLNHMLKTRSRILNNNAKLAATAKTKKVSKEDLIVADTYRDQGLVRPKILVILPLRDSAFKVVNTLIDLLFGKDRDKAKSKNQIMNYDRFESEYTGNNLYLPKTNPKPVDYEKTFSGNTDDNFRIGITLTKKSMKLYTEFYSSDIIVASPLALRLVIAGSTEANVKDYDFLNSIEMLIIDQAELLFAQNWENLLHVLEHLHLQPQSLRDTNFQRVREWYLSGLAKYYRQTLLFSTHELPELRALFNKCSNYEGKVRVQNPIDFGNMRNIIVSHSQVFERVNVSSLTKMHDERFTYFIQKVLPKFKNPSFAHCMIYVPSYFDYVRIRNYFRKETINFTQICEYTEKGKMAKARDLFFHSGAHFLLYSERSHFFKRTRIKGIRNLIMYQPPNFPHFYSEMINLMQEGNQNKQDGLEDSMSITVLYTKYDILQLCNIIGTTNAMKIVNSSKNVHAFATELAEL